MKTREDCKSRAGSSSHGGILLLSLSHPAWELCTLGGIVQGMGMGYLEPKDILSTLYVPYSNKPIGV